MCGIVGYVGHRDAAPILLEGLHRLEYRGYDSAGIAVQVERRLQTHKTVGRVQALRDIVPTPLAGTTGIAHTRWATHGEPTERNAHPHLDTACRIAVVHNGIIENADALRARLVTDGVAFASDTDTEVLAHMIARSDAATLEEAVRETLREVDGTYGVVVLDAARPGEMVAARNGSPLVLGIGEHEMLVASDMAALVRFTQRAVFLDDNELATIRAEAFTTSTLTAQRTSHAPTTVEMSAAEYELDGHPDFLHKEMHEQPLAVDRCLRGRLDDRFMTARLDGVGLDAREVREVRSVKFLGCGSAYYAGQFAADLVEDLARIPADAEPASEFRYRNPVIDPDALYVAISQSGETLDTLAAIQEVQRKGGRVLGVVNVVGSAIARECGNGVFLHAGPEISVAATKSFTNMGVALALLALRFGRVRDLSVGDGRRLAAGLRRMPEMISQVLDSDAHVATIAHRYADTEHMFFIGRVRGWPVAREGAQKLKEVSYLHAEAYQAAELKHGPLALITPAHPTVAVVPDDDLLAKNIGTLTEIKARGGPIIAVTNVELPCGLADEIIRVPCNEPELDPLLLNIPLQSFAYHLAVKLGREVDRPRNLAKSVTVE
ncbi:MAG: glutamine--fructose-6-phosphate transaminase (isomerizing) [Sciscionella sp.]